MEFGFEDLVGQVERGGGDALEQLGRAAEKSKEVSAMADALLDHFVEKGRAAGLTWAQIGEALNISKQAAQQRSARFVGEVTVDVTHGAPMRVEKHLSPGVAERLRALAGVRAPRFHRFTDRARRSVVLAQEAAAGFGHNYVGTEHLLLGVLRGETVGAAALRACGISEQQVAAAIEESVGRGSGTPEGKAPFTPRAKKALELSLREALKLGHNYIGTEHMVLALRNGDPDGPARKILEGAGVDAERLRAEVTRLLEERRRPERGEPGAPTA